MRIKNFAAKIRLETCEMVLHRGFGHLGGALSVVELLAVLYGEEMQIDPKRPGWEERDYMVLSKGHAGPALYSTLGLLGYFPEEKLRTLNDDGTKLPSHPDRRLTRGVDATTGSLGQGISMAVGMAQALKMDGKKNRVFCIIGDGECNEGQVWEALQYAAAKGLDNLFVFVDENLKQLDGTTDSILKPFDLRAKGEAFGMDAQRVDGKSEAAIRQAIETAKGRAAQAHFIVLDTIKGQGVPFIEEMDDNHHIRLSDEHKVLLGETIKALKAKIKEEA